MKQVKNFNPYKFDTTLIVSKDDQGFRIDGDLIEIRKQNGIVSIANHSVGVGHSCHPNIDASGSVKGMKQLGYWRKEDKTVKAHGFIYNVSSIVISHPLDLLAYMMEVHGYEIKKSVLEQAGNPLWGGISITLPKISE